MAASQTAKVVDFIAGTTAESIPADVYRAARRIFVDTLAAIVVGTREEPVRILREFARSEGALPRALLFGSALRTSPQLAALVNGTAAHAIEFDDACAEGHLSAVLVPAVLALAEDLGSSGRDTLAAFCVGFEVASKVGRTLLGDDYHHHWRGWHSTPANGAIGAAAAAAWLLQLDQTQTACALGHAATWCAGFRKNFGTMTKPFHAGHAAQAGVIAAMLARSGFTASTEIFDAPLGYFDVLAEGHQQIRHLGTLGMPWSLTHPGVNVREYPSCYLTMRVADAILRNEAFGNKEFRNEEITSIDLHLSDTEANTLVYDQPQTGLQAKFSAQYIVAAALLDGALQPGSFSDAMVLRPPAQQLMKKMRKLADAGNGPAQIRVHLSNGDEIVRACDVPLGAAARPFDDTVLTQKFSRCAAGILPATASEAALQLLSRLEEIEDIRALVKLLAGSADPHHNI